MVTDSHGIKSLSHHLVARFFNTRAPDSGVTRPHVSIWGSHIPRVSSRPWGWQGQAARVTACSSLGIFEEYVGGGMGWGYLTNDCLPEWCGWIYLTNEVCQPYLFHECCLPEWGGL